MRGHKTFIRRKIVVIFVCFILVMSALLGRLYYLMIVQSEYYSEKALALHEREREIKAKRGRILDQKGRVLADNKSVCTISIIHSQIKEPDRVIEVLSRELELPREKVEKLVNKVSSMERIKSNVDKSLGEKIREYELSGVKVDEDFKRYYPYNDLASTVLGFTGSDNQGIIGLEVVYDEILQGKNGQILTLTDASGRELSDMGETRKEPVDGNDLQISIDLDIQSYATQLANQTMAQKNAEGVSMIVMRPENGEILAMVNVPEFDLNNPFVITEQSKELYRKKLERGEKINPDLTSQDALNFMWRNRCVCDTYEPGSTFKTVTATAALEQKEVSLEEGFHCPGYIVVEDRKIRCHKVGGHGAETFTQAIMNSCNPVFVNIGLRLGVDRFYEYFDKLKLYDKTGIDIPGEAGTIMHKKENVGAVELATMSFGQSFQVTPMRFLTTFCTIINGGTEVTPHFAVASYEGEKCNKYEFQSKKGIISKETSETMRYLLEQVVENGGGNKAYIEGVRIGGKTATSQTLPRGSGRYISSFIGFVPANQPKVVAMVIIYTPQGIYYGGQIAAPVIKNLFENILQNIDEIEYN